MNVRGERIIVFGDSTSHHGSDNAPEIWDVDQGSGRSSGQPGDLLASLLKEQGAEAVRVNARVSRSAPNFFGREDYQGLFNSDRQFGPTKVVIILGTNDLHVSRAIDEAAMRQIVGFYEGLGAEVWGVGPWMYANESLNRDAEPVIEMQKQIFGGRFIDPRPITAVVGRSSDGVHFGGEASRQTALGLADLLLSTSSPKNWMPIAVGAAIVVGLGLVWSYWRQRKLPTHGRPLLGSSDPTPPKPKKKRESKEVRAQRKALEAERDQLYRSMAYAGNTPDQVRRFHDRIDVINAKMKALGGLGASILPPGATFIVEDAANAVAKSKRFGDRNVFVSDVYKEVKKAGVDISFEDFKRELLRMHREGNVRLSRADYVAAMDPKKVLESEINADGADFHFVNLDGLGKLGKLGAKEDPKAIFKQLLLDPDPASMETAQDLLLENEIKLSQIGQTFGGNGGKFVLNKGRSPSDNTEIGWQMWPEEGYNRCYGEISVWIHGERVMWPMERKKDSPPEDRLELEYSGSKDFCVRATVADAWATAKAVKTELHEAQTGEGWTMPKIRNRIHKAINQNNSEPAELYGLDVSNVDIERIARDIEEENKPDAAAMAAEVRKQMTPYRRLGVRVKERGFPFQKSSLTAFASMCMPTTVHSRPAFCELRNLHKLADGSIIASIRSEPYSRDPGRSWIVHFDNAKQFNHYKREGAITDYRKHYSPESQTRKGRREPKD